MQNYCSYAVEAGARIPPGLHRDAAVLGLFAGKSVLRRLCSPVKACLEGVAAPQGALKEALLAGKGVFRWLRAPPRSPQGALRNPQVAPKEH